MKDNLLLTINEYCRATSGVNQKSIQLRFLPPQRLKIRLLGLRCHPQWSENSHDSQSSPVASRRTSEILETTKINQAGKRYQDIRNLRNRRRNISDDRTGNL